MGASKHTTHIVSSHRIRLRCARSHSRAPPAAAAPPPPEPLLEPQALCSLCSLNCRSYCRLLCRRPRSLRLLRSGQLNHRPRLRHQRCQRFTAIPVLLRLRRRLLHRAQYTVSVERVKGSEYKAVQRGDTRVNGTRENRHGIQLVVVFSGEVGSFDFQTLLVNLAGGAGLLAVGAVIVDFIALYVAPGELPCTAFHP
jgi:hypothetical protein